MTGEMHLFRLGRIPDGAPPTKGQRDINQCKEPPKMNRRMYSAALELSQTVA